MNAKKLMALALCLTMFGGSMMASGCNLLPSNSSSTASSSVTESSLEESSSEEDVTSEDSSSSAEEEIQETWYEERSGYKFCGYYKDRNFKYPVTEIVTEETAKNYYAKYQMDKVQQAACVPTNLNYTIYANNFQSALCMYMYDVYGIYDLSRAQMVDYSAYGISYSASEIMSNSISTGWHEMMDTSQTMPCDYRSMLIPSYMPNYDEPVTRDNAWTAYVVAEEDAQVTQDGWVYIIVDSLYAAIIGCVAGSESQFATARVPEQISGYPVQEVCLTDRNDYSFCAKEGIPSVETLIIPSTVENVRIMFTRMPQECPIENLVIEEGVKTVRLSAHAAKNISLPASAWYVDICNEVSVLSKDFLKPDQTITVADGGHYYTNNGCLYSVEGDLCYQFANKSASVLRIDENAKRVLPSSLTGVAKNIYIPEGLEYFDWMAFFGGLRSSWIQGVSAVEKTVYAPVFFIDSPKVAEQMLMDIVLDLGYFFPVMLFNNAIDMDSVWESVEDMIYAEYGSSMPADALAQQIAFIKLFMKDSGVNGYRVWAAVEEGETYLRVDGNAVYVTVANVNNEREEYLLTYLDYTNVTDYSFDPVF